MDHVYDIEYSVFGTMRITAKDHDEAVKKLYCMTDEELIENIDFNSLDDGHFEVDQDEKGVFA